MDMIKRALEKNPKVCIVAETDKICGYCPNNSSGICTNGDKVAGYDWKTLELCGLEAGTEMGWKEFEGLVKENILDAGKGSRFAETANGIRFAIAIFWKMHKLL